MMPFNCSYRNKNEPTAIYPSLGYFPPGKKISKCDDAPAMTLVVQWWLSCRLIPVAELYFSVG